MRISLNANLPDGGTNTDMRQLVYALTQRLTEIAIQLNALSEGRQVAHYAAMSAVPTLGNFAAGDFIHQRVPVELGVAGAKYVITGFMCIAAGTPGTWRECRSLTGN